MFSKTRLAISAAIVLSTVAAGVAKDTPAGAHPAGAKHRIMRQIPANAFGMTGPRFRSPPPDVLNDYPHVFCCS